MKIPPKVKIIAGLLVVFAAGAICGSWARSIYSERILVKCLNYTNWAPAMIQGLNHELNLSPEQEKQARAMVDESVTQIAGGFAKMGDELVRLHCRLQTILSPEQQAKNAKSFEDFRRALKEKYNLCLSTQIDPKETATPGSEPNKRLMP
jgi:hypothetical protein